MSCIALQKGGFAEGLKSNPARYVGHAKVYETVYHSEVEQRACRPLEVNCSFGIQLEC